MTTSDSSPSETVKAPIEPSDALGLLRSYSRHLMFVRFALHAVTHALDQRAEIHDATKMLDDEFAGFSRINAAARVNKFGSPGYADGMRRERGTIDLHFSRNRHHPERPSLIAGKETEPDDARYWEKHDAERMRFIDIIEMVCDWWGAGKGYDSPMPWIESVELNLKQKGKYLSPEQIWLAREVAAFLGKQND